MELITHGLHSLIPCYHSLQFNMTTEDVEDAKRYMADKQIFQLFESLLTAVVQARPEQPVAFLQQCLAQVHDVKEIQWNSFLDVGNRSDKDSQTIQDPAQYKKLFETELDTKQ